MKKNNSFTTESDVKNVENKQSEQQKVREGQPDSSILSDKDPVVKNDKAFKEQDEFIDRNNNRKSEG
ncbi:hypothetical protein HNQ91_005948 [Filimonas zeae]|uniref:Uncharacterized protein n=1 Tax=Filimonas zeae TaxID=1737353 RepID=A0A917J730_9BACT|nr:hypothetical protein [Filimonas zeae]MDR6342861.1 hypothetical protein [Filimonas zeae]GGH82994.1 hypothetical protein GCM10011379_57720 [Filimonas zeae]